MTGPAFALPPPPSGWRRGELVRLVDPTGDAIAWLSPGQGAACLALHVRDDHGTWRDVVTDGDDPGITIDGKRTTWELAMRDPTSCELTTPGATLTAWVADRALWIEVHVTPYAAVHFGIGVSLDEPDGVARMHLG